MLAMLVSC